MITDRTIVSFVLVSQATSLVYSAGVELLSSGSSAVLESLLGVSLLLLSGVLAFPPQPERSKDRDITPARISAKSLFFMLSAPIFLKMDI